jgi:hypothetical protein
MDYGDAPPSFFYCCWTFRPAATRSRIVAEFSDGSLAMSSLYLTAGTSI